MEKNGDSWHLCFKDEVESNWKEYMLKASGPARSKRLKEDSPPFPAFTFLTKIISFGILRRCLWIPCLAGRAQLQ